MSADLQPLGRALLVFGLVLTAAGLLLLVAPKVSWLGRLPGDIRIEREHFTVYLPLATSLLISIGLSLLLWLWSRFQR